MIKRILYIPTLLIFIVKITWFVTHAYFTGKTMHIIALTIAIKAVNEDLNLLVIDDKELQNLQNYYDKNKEEYNVIE